MTATLEISPMDILTMPLEKLLAAAPTPEKVRLDIERRSRRLSDNRQRAATKRAQEQELKAQLLSTGGGWMLAYLCENGQPDASATRGLISRPRAPHEEIYDARFDGRYIPDCEFQGIKRYAAKGRITYRAYRFLATDFCNDFGGLNIEKSKLGTCYSPLIERASKSWQMKDPAEQTVEDIQQGQRRFAKPHRPRCPDERIQDWSSGKEVRDWRPYRGPSFEQEIAKSNSEWQAEVERVNADRRQKICA